MENKLTSLLKLAKAQGIDMKDVMKEACKEIEKTEEKKRFKVEVEISNDGFRRYKIKVTDSVSGKEKHGSADKLEIIDREAKWQAQRIIEEIKEDANESLAPKLFYLDVDELNENGRY